MKITKSLIKQILKEELIKEKKDREAFTGDLDLRGGEAVTDKLPKKMDAVIYNVPNYETDTRDYFYGLVTDIEELDRQTKDIDYQYPIKVLALFMSGQTKKGSASGEVGGLEAIEDPTSREIDSGEVQVLRDQGTWKKKLAAQLKLKAAEKRSRM
jgi:hypothetical protein